jgi:hypothetical protein
MGWQDLAVALILAGAVLFLLNRVLGLRRRRRQSAQSFVPLSQLKKTARPPDDTPDCH